MCESRQTARKVTYCLATAFQEYSKSIRAADAGSKRFAIDLRSPEDLEAELRAADSSEAWFLTYALRPTPMWPYSDYRPRLEDDSRLRLYTEAISTVVVTKSSSVFCRIFLSHPRMRLLDLNSLIIRIQSPLRVECSITYLSLTHALKAALWVWKYIIFPYWKNFTSLLIFVSK